MSVLLATSALLVEIWLNAQDSGSDDGASSENDDLDSLADLEGLFCHSCLSL